MKLAMSAIFFTLILTSVTTIAEPKKLKIDTNTLPSSRDTKEDTIIINKTIDFIQNTTELKNNKIINISIPQINQTIQKPSIPKKDKNSKDESNIDNLKNSFSNTNNYFNSLPKENTKEIWKDIKNVDLFPKYESTQVKRIEFLQDLQLNLNEYNINILDNTNFIFNNLKDIPAIIVDIIPLKLPWDSGEDKENNVGDIELIGATMGGIFLLGYLATSGSTKYSSLFLPIPLYSRIKKEKVLEHKTRDDIYTFVSKNPGASRLSIKQSLSLANGSTGHHLRTLEREGFIKSIKHGRLRQFYVCGTKVSELSEIQEKIAKIIEQNPGITQTEVASKIGVSRQAVNYQIKYLADKGIIHVVTSGRKTTCYYNEQAS